MLHLCNIFYISIFKPLTHNLAGVLLLLYTFIQAQCQFSLCAMVYNW